jgi:hypothetical protein
MVTFARAAALGLLCAGCISNPASGTLLCDKGLCPNGMTCSNDLCYVNGAVPPPDAGGSGGSTGGSSSGSTGGSSGNSTGGGLACAAQQTSCSPACVLPCHCDNILTNGCCMVPLGMCDVDNDCCAFRNSPEHKNGCDAGVCECLASGELCTNPADCCSGSCATTCQ